MCGIAGILGGSLSPEERRARCEKMSDAIEHRGPDDHGIFAAPQAPIVMAHRRLSIIDTSPAGHRVSRVRWKVIGGLTEL